MKKDFIIGSAVSALILGSIFASSFLYQTRADPVALPKPPPIERPPMVVNLDPPEPVPGDPNDIPLPRPTVMPPKERDLPQTPIIDVPTQELQPDVPADLIPDPGIITIPNTPGPGLSSEHRIIDNSLLEQKPSPRSQMPPQYPFEMRNAGIEGEVAVEFIVDMNGNVRNPFVVRSTHREFEDAALQAISKWRFRPGRKDGRIVNAGRVQQLFTFRIND
ncbi:MAG: energy transducer TonB [Opitutaceae bacterium]|nr:energy transducer TonB [Opitutaceae bacterium]